MENQNVIKWIRENKDMWNLICGVDGEPELEQIQETYNCLCCKAKTEEAFHVLLLTLLTRYGKSLFPEETETTEELAFNKYLKAVK